MSQTEITTSMEPVPPRPFIKSRNLSPREKVLRQLMFMALRDGKLFKICSDLLVPEHEEKLNKIYQELFQVEDAPVVVDEHVDV